MSLRALRIVLAVLSAAALCGCAAEGPDPVSTHEPRTAAEVPRETEHPQAHTRSLTLACDTEAAVLGRRLTLHGRSSEAVLTDALADGPFASADGDRLAWTEAARTPGATILRATACRDGRWSSPFTLVDDRGCPDRVAFAPDGRSVAYVSSSDGIAAIFVVDSDGGRPQQVTNVGVSRAGARPGAPPAGFLPVPHASPPRFEAGFLRWQAADGPHEAVLP